VDPSRPRPGRPVLVAGAPDSLKRIQSLPLLGAAKEPLLIQGEAGVGKRLTAAAIHSWAIADQGEPQWVHAGAISEGWIVRWQRRLQASEATDGQGLFVVIENIEQLDLDLQGRLLPMLEDHADNAINQAGRKNLRLITLAEADLARLTRQGRFRQDLYHRISVLKLNLPPLRDRLDDIVALADFFAAAAAVSNGASVLRLPDAVRGLLATYHWPGNVAELRDAIQQSPLAQGAKEGKVALGDWFRDYIERHRHPFGVSAIDVSGELRRFLKNNRDTSLKRAKQHCGRQVEIRFMRAALSRTNGNFKQAARLLRISYKSMLNKAKAYHLSG
jgi:DNA-binding NtrC family response regulator